MVSQDKDPAGTEDSQKTGQESESTGEPKGKKSVEDRLDDMADRFSKVMTEGIKKMEEAFDQGMKTIRENPNLSSGRVKGFFTSSTGGAVLVLVGFVWFFYAVGLLDNAIFPILVIVVGFYLMHRYREQ